MTHTHWFYRTRGSAGISEDSGLIIECLGERMMFKLTRASVTAESLQIYKNTGFEQQRSVSESRGLLLWHIRGVWLFVPPAKARDPEGFCPTLFPTFRCQSCHVVLKPDQSCRRQTHTWINRIHAHTVKYSTLSVGVYILMSLHNKRAVPGRSLPVPFSSANFWMRLSMPIFSTFCLNSSWTCSKEEQKDFVVFVTISVKEVL